VDRGLARFSSGHRWQALSVAERTTTHEYFADNDPVAPARLKKVTGPSGGGAAGPTMSLTYDVQGRVKTSTDADGYVLTMDYDSLDRQTKVTYPDASYEQTTYNRLDPEARRDRLGRWNHTFHDSLRRARAVRDPLGRTLMNWCSCWEPQTALPTPLAATTWEALAGSREEGVRAVVREYTYGTRQPIEDAQGPEAASEDV
jgi:YD repeat-containing protein